MAVCIETKNLTKRFGTLKAVDGLTIKIEKNEIFGLVGPDASGKTTILRMLCGILPPDDGKATVLGLDLKDKAEDLKERLGYLPQRPGVYGDLTVLENINFYADLHRVPRALRRERIERLLAIADLGIFRKRRAQDLSGGMRQKLGLICALIHRPHILLLDEPTSGVDPVSRRDFWLILYELLGEGVTIVFSTSYLDEAERCSTVGFLYKGKLLIADTPRKIKEGVRATILELRPDNLRGALKILEDCSDFKGVFLKGDRIHVLVDDPKKGKTKIMELLSRNRIGVACIEAVSPSLDDAFVSILKEKATYPEGTQ